MPSEDSSTYQLVATFGAGAVASASCKGPPKPKQIPVAPAAEAVTALPPAEPPEPSAGLKKGASRVVRRSGTGVGPTSPPVAPDSGGARRPGTPSKAAAGQRPGTPGSSAASAAGSAAAPASSSDADKQAGQGQVASADAAIAEANGKDSVLAPASATAAAVRVCIPSGLMVELNSEGWVLMAPVVSPQLKVSG